MVKKKSRGAKSDMLEEEMVNLSRERTVLSKERTILSFMQTGLAFIGIGIVIINVFGTTNNPSNMVGWMLIFIGFVEVIECVRRLMKYRRKMKVVKSALGPDQV